VHHQIEQSPDFGAKVMLFRYRIAHCQSSILGRDMRRNGTGFNPAS
jgi:hypothetical protein